MCWFIQIRKNNETKIKDVLINVHIYIYLYVHSSDHKEQLNVCDDSFKLEKKYKTKIELVSYFMCSP
jgi:hypothetical protein